MALVVDASIAVGWFAASQATSLTDRALSQVAGEPALVPGHFGIEVARALRRLERRGLMAPDRTDAVLGQLRALGLEQDSRATLDALAAVVDLARRHRLTVADAAYLELAFRMGAVLATRDGPLAAAAESAGVPLFTASEVR
jgi:predicted nucleic acid-binding protein